MSALVGVNNDFEKLERMTTSERKKLKTKTATELKKLVHDVNERATVAMQERLPKCIEALKEVIENKLPKMLEGYEKEHVNIAVDLSGAPVSSKKRGADEISASSPQPAKKKRRLEGKEEEGKAETTREDQLAAVSVWRKKAIRTDFELSRLNTSVSCNGPISKVCILVQEHLVEQIELVGQMKFSVSLKIPKMEDGNNFGVAVQEEMLSELAVVEDRCFSNLEEISKYFVDRGKIVSKVLKWPQIADWREAVHELDCKMALDLKCSLIDVMNDYSILSDLMVKNKDKIEKPRAASGSNFMY